MLPALRIGSRYSARVVRLLADGRVQLALGDHTLTARAQAQVRQGAEITVEVLKLVPDVVLKVIARRRQNVPGDPAKNSGSRAAASDESTQSRAGR